MRNAVIISTGAYAPQRVLPNSYFDELLGTPVSPWLEKMNIYQRHWCGPDESTADLAVAAGQQALERAGIKASDIDLILVATDTPEYISPSTAALVQYRMQAGYAGTFDLNHACAGFITALNVGAKFISTEPHLRYVLVIGAYAMSKFLNPEDKKTLTLFADGAAAAVLGGETGASRGVLATDMITLGQYYDGMGIYAGGAKKPITTAAALDEDRFIRMVYKFPPELNPQMWERMARTLCKRVDATPAEVDQYIFTQININSIRLVMNRLSQPFEKTHTIMDRYAFTGAACVGMAMNDAIEQGKIKENDLVVLISSGSGLAFSGLALRF